MSHNNDCNSAVSGKQYNEAVKIVKKICRKIDFIFDQYGLIEGSNFISKNDWKTFTSVFGESTKSFNPAIKFKKSNK